MILFLAMTREPAIERALRACKSLIVVVSPDAVVSREVNAEWRAALQDGKLVVPLIHKSCEIPFRLNSIQYVDFRDKRPDWPQGIDQLAYALNRSAPPGGVAPSPPRRSTTLSRATAFGGVAVVSAGLYFGYTRATRQTESPAGSEQKEIKTPSPRPATPVKPDEIKPSLTPDPGASQLAHNLADNKVLSPQPERRSALAQNTVDPPNSSAARLPVQSTKNKQADLQSAPAENPVHLAEAGRCQQALPGLERQVRSTIRTQMLLIGSVGATTRQETIRHAVAALTTALRNNDRVSHYFRFRGLARWKLQDTTGALSDLGEAIRLDPDRPDAYIDRGRVHDTLRDYQSAVNDYRKATRLAPGNRSAQIALGEALVNNGDKELGRQIIDRAPK